MILQLRERRNLTVDQVSAYLGISTEHYQDLEEGRAIPNSVTLESLADLFSLPIEAFAIKENIIININCGTASHSNSGYIHSYINEASSCVGGNRLAEMENLLRQILIHLKFEEVEFPGTLSE
ncbi:helix-turn-helix domain-containing protein [Flavitalea sp.]|nr:helix-turn-helix transcriptional regulator [Flavitalea sp.]